MCLHMSLVNPSQCAVCSGLVRVAPIKRVQERRKPDERPRMIVTDEFAEYLGLDPCLPLIGPTQVICSFCGVTVDETKAQAGSGPLKKTKRTTIQYADGRPVELHQQASHYTDKLFACPLCVLQLAPIDDPAEEAAHRSLYRPSQTQPNPEPR